MLAVGFDKQTIEEAIGQLYSVSYAPWQIIPCPGLQVIPEKDHTIFGGPSRAKISQEFLANRHLYSGTGTVAFKENDYLVSLITSDITPTAEDEHPISYIERDNNWHMLEPTVTYGEEVSQAISVALSYSIANSIHNHNNPLFTPRPDSDKTLSRIQSILGSTQNANFTQAIEQIKEI
jgi:hypothetical protein